MRKPVVYICGLVLLVLVFNFSIAGNMGSLTNKGDIALHSTLNPLSATDGAYLDQFNDSLIGSEWVFSSSNSTDLIENGDSIKFDWNGTGIDWEYASISQNITWNVGTIIETAGYIDYKYHMGIVMLRLNNGISGTYSVNIALFDPWEYSHPEIRWYVQDNTGELVDMRNPDPNDHIPLDRGEFRFRIEFISIASAYVEVDYPGMSSTFKDVIHGFENIASVSLEAAVQVSYSTTDEIIEFDYFAKDDYPYSILSPNYSGTGDTNTYTTTSSTRSSIPTFPNTNTSSTLEYEISLSFINLVSTFSIIGITTHIIRRNKKY